MRLGLIQRIGSRLLGFTVAILAVPLAMSVYDRDSVWYAWVLPMLAAGALSVVLHRMPSAKDASVSSLRRREGLLAVTMSWLVLVFFTAIAYWLTFEVGGFAECIFESMSGFTTTGATVVANIEGLPRSVLLMRSWSHWIGGMGIIVLSVAILPELGVGGMQLVEAESSGLDSEKLAPRIAGTARRLWGLYLGITALQSILLRLGGLSWFDSVNHAMATIATGGFSTKNASVGAFDSVYVELVITAFMFLSGLNFVLMYRSLIVREGKRLFRSPEVQLYTLITAGSCVVVSLAVYGAGTYDSLLDAVRYSTFQVVSIITTTGFGTADFDTWPHFARLMLVALMLVGGCAGSTAGGIKVVRLYVVMKHAAIQLHRLMRPRIVRPLEVGDRTVSASTTESVLGFLWLYFFSHVMLSLLMTALGLDLISGASAAVSAMNSIGPGLGSVGPARSFAHVPDVGLLGLSFGMLLGRLEIYTVLVLLTPRFWRQR